MRTTAKCHRAIPSCCLHPGGPPAYPSRELRVVRRNSAVATPRSRFIPMSRACLATNPGSACNSPDWMHLADRRMVRSWARGSKPRLVIIGSGRCGGSWVRRLAGG